MAETLHFGRAAERLGVAQPAVSQQLARLERELGVVLLHRTSHRVALTPAGAALLPDAREALSAAARLRGRAADLAAGTTGTLRIATTSGVGARLGAALTLFATRHPGVRVELPVLTTVRKLEAVRDGTVDLALFRSAPTALEGLRTQVVWEEPFVAVLPARFASETAGSSITATLSGLPMVQIPRAEHPTMRAEIRSVCDALGIDPPPGPEVHTQQEVLATIATGVAWTFFLPDNVPSAYPGLVVRPLPDTAPPSRVRAVWRATANGPWTAPFVAALADRAAGTTIAADIGRRASTDS